MKKNVYVVLFLIVVVSVFTFAYVNSRERLPWYYPSWANSAKYNEPIKVLDTQSALGRYSTREKEITLKDLALIHGHLCDGLVISYVELSAVLKKLFPDGVIDRTDLRVVSKNGPCWVDAAAMITGARINFGMLSISPSVGDGFIVQRISTGETYSVHLKDGVFPKKQADLEKKIRDAQKNNLTVSPKDVDRVEKMQDDLSKKILNTPPDKILKIEKLQNYKFVQNFTVGKRGDILNKNVAIR